MKVDIQAVEEEILVAIQEYKTGKKEGNFEEYIIALQDETFSVYATKDEVCKSAHIALEIIEELKRINKNGLNRTKVAELNKKIDEYNESREAGNLIQKLFVYKEVQNDRISQLVSEAANTMRVGGAWYVLLARPMIDSVIYSVYDQLVDDFDNVNLYRISTYFLFRGILKMHGNTIGEDDLTEA